MSRGRLREVVHQVTTKAHGRKPSGSRYVGLEHIKSDAQRVIGTAPSSFSQGTNGVFEEGDVLFGKLRPNLRKGVQVGFGGYCSTDLLVLRPRKSVHTRYAGYVATSESVFRHAERNSIGTRMPRTSWYAVSQAPVWLPPLEEQRRIAEILDTIDETIQATERVIAKLHVTADGLIAEAVESALRAREFRSLGEIADNSPGSLIQTGPFGSQLHASEYVNEGIPAFMPTDIKDGKLDFSGAAKISVKKADELGRHRLRTGDVLFARRGDLLRCAVVAPDQREGLCGTGCLLVRIPEAELAPDWLVTVYRHDAVQRQVLARAVGSTMLNLSAGLIRSLSIPYPTQDSQRLMALAQESSHRIETERTSQAKLGALRSGLAADLLSGRIRTVAA